MDARPTILVVDDVPMFRELESLFLAGCGRVLTASSGEEALACVVEERPRVVVLDADLPDRSGIEVCRAIRSDRALAGTHVVVVTAHGAAEDHARAVRAGAEDVLAKPLTREGLVDAVARFARHRDPRGLPRVKLDRNFFGPRLEPALPSGSGRRSRSTTASISAVHSRYVFAESRPHGRLVITFIVRERLSKTTTVSTSRNIASGTRRSSCPRSGMCSRYRTAS